MSQLPGQELPVTREVRRLYLAEYARRWQDFRFAVGYGVGARWASPVGPLGLDLAYGVDARQARLHFTLDVSF